MTDQPPRPRSSSPWPQPRATGHVFDTVTTQGNARGHFGDQYNYTDERKYYLNVIYNIQGNASCDARSVQISGSAVLNQKDELGCFEAEVKKGAKGNIRPDDDIQTYNQLDTVKVIRSDEKCNELGSETIPRVHSASYLPQHRRDAGVLSNKPEDVSGRTESQREAERLVNPANFELTQSSKLDRRKTLKDWVADGHTGAPKVTSMLSRSLNLPRELGGLHGDASKLTGVDTERQYERPMSTCLDPSQCADTLLSRVYNMSITTTRVDPGVECSKQVNSHGICRWHDGTMPRAFETSYFVIAEREAIPQCQQRWLSRQTEERRVTVIGKVRADMFKEVDGIKMPKFKLRHFMGKRICEMEDGIDAADSAAEKLLRIR